MCKKVASHLIAVQVVMTLTSPLASANGLTFSNEQLCKAAVSTVMGRSPKTMKTRTAKGGIVHLSYKRPDDGTLWKLKCKTEGREIVWATEGGRWRDHPDDGKVYFSTPKAGMLHIEQRFPDGSKIDKEFSKKQLH